MIGLGFVDQGVILLRGGGECFLPQKLSTVHVVPHTTVWQKKIFYGL